MTPEERAARERHPAGRRRAAVTPHSALRPIHSDTHTWGQEASRAPENPPRRPAPSPIGVAAALQLAVGIIVTVWTRDLRVLATAVVGAYLDRRPR